MRCAAESWRRVLEKLPDEPANQDVFEDAIVALVRTGNTSEAIDWLLKFKDVLHVPLMFAVAHSTNRVTAVELQELTRAMGEAPSPDAVNGLLHRMGHATDYPRYQ